MCINNIFNKNNLICIFIKYKTTIYRHFVFQYINMFTSFFVRMEHK